MRTKRQGERQIDRACREPLQHRDLDRVGAGELSSEIVVDAPRETGARDGDRADAQAFGRPSPGEHHGTGDDRQRPQEDPPVEVLRKDRPGDDDRRHAFVQVEQTAGFPTLDVRFDRDAIARYGLSVAEVADTVAAANGRT